MEIILPVVIVAFGAFCIWTIVRGINDPKQWRTSFGMVVAAVLLTCCVFACLIPPLGHPPEATWRSRCKYNLKQIGLALHTYHDHYGSFPPAYVADSNGRPMHSWRVLLLPYLDQKPLYNRYRLDEPWDGPSNRKLAGEIMAVYNCPSDVHARNNTGSTMTNYVAVVGPETAWPGSRSTAARDFKDGTSATLLIVEVANSGIHWMEPRDLHVLQMAPTINAKAGQGISSTHGHGAHVLMGDGAVRFISDQTTTAELIRGLLTVNGKETIGGY